MKESLKIKEKVSKYFDPSKLILDIGCGDQTITPYAIGVDHRNLPNVKLVADIERLDLDHQEYVGKCDVVLSSHALEHVFDEYGTLKSWIKLLKIGGILILYLPDDRYYKDNLTNIEHLRIYNYEVFFRWFDKGFSEMRVLESGLHVNERMFDEDCYSFYIISRKEK